MTRMAGFVFAVLMAAVLPGFLADDAEVLVGVPTAAEPPTGDSPPNRTFEFFDYWAPEDANVVMFSEFDNDSQERVLWEWDIETGGYTRVFGDDDSMFARTPGRDGDGLVLRWDSFGFATDASQVYFTGRYDFRSFWFIYDRASGVLTTRLGDSARSPRQDPIFPVEEPFVWQVGGGNVVDLTTGFTEYSHDTGLTLGLDSTVRLATSRDELDEARLVFQDEINLIGADTRAPITAFGYTFVEPVYETSEPDPDDPFGEPDRLLISAGERLVDYNSRFAIVSRTEGPLMAFDYDPEENGPEDAALLGTSHYDAMVSGGPLFDVTALLPSEFQDNVGGQIARYSNQLLVTAYTGGPPVDDYMNPNPIDRDTMYAIVDLESEQIVASWITSGIPATSRRPTTPHLVGDGMLVAGSVWVREGEFIDARATFLPGPLGADVEHEPGTFIEVNSVPSDPTYPECLANMSFPDVDVPRICFQLGTRQASIDLLTAPGRGAPAGETIWIGSFNEEAVAP